MSGAGRLQPTAARRHPPRFRAVATLSSALGLSSVSWLLILAPVSASGVGPATVWKAPFHVALKSLTDSHSLAGCGVAKNVRDAFFNVKNGKGGFIETASAPACTGHLPHSGWAFGGFALTIPVTAAAGNHTVIVQSIGAASAVQNISLGNCHKSTVSNWGCTQWTQAQLSGDSSLLEMNGSTLVTRWASSNVWKGLSTESYNSSTCAHSSCVYSSAGGPGGFAGNFSFALYINATFTAGHTYFVQVDVQGFAEVLFAGYNTYLAAGHGDAALDVGSNGNFVKLLSITVR